MSNNNTIHINIVRCDYIDKSKSWEPSPTNSGITEVPFQQLKTPNSTEIDFTTKMNPVTEVKL